MINIVLRDVASQESFTDEELELCMEAVPRVGESLALGQRLFRVIDVIWRPARRGSLREEAELVVQRSHR